MKTSKYVQQISIQKYTLCALFSLNLPRSKIAACQNDYK